MARPVCRGTLYGDCRRGQSARACPGPALCALRIAGGALQPPRHSQITPRGERKGEHVDSPVEPEEHTLESSERIVLECSCGERLVLLGLEEDCARNSARNSSARAARASPCQSIVSTKMFWSSEGSCGAPQSPERLTLAASDLERGLAARLGVTLPLTRTRKGAREGGVVSGPKKLICPHHSPPLLRTRDGAIKQPEVGHPTRETRASCTRASLPPTQHSYV